MREGRRCVRSSGRCSSGAIVRASAQRGLRAWTGSGSSREATVVVVASAIVIVVIVVVAVAVVVVCTVPHERAALSDVAKAARAHQIGISTPRHRASRAAVYGMRARAGGSGHARLNPFESRAVYYGARAGPSLGLD